MTIEDFKEEMLDKKDYEYIDEILWIDCKIDALEREDVFYDETFEFEKLCNEKKYFGQKLLENHPELEADGLDFAYSIIHEMKKGILNFNTTTGKWEVNKDTVNKEKE